MRGSVEQKNELRARLAPAQASDEGGHNLRWRIKCQQEEGSGTVDS
jgi:hypothetical protein